MTKNKLITLGVSGIVTVVAATAAITGFNASDYKSIRDDFVQDCAATEVAIDTKIDTKKRQVKERVCMSDKQYKDLKKSLSAVYDDKTKNYDFPVEDMDILSGVLRNEVATRGLNISGNVTREKIRSEFIRLLKTNE